MITHGTYAQCEQPDFRRCYSCFTTHCALAGCDAPPAPRKPEWVRRAEAQALPAADLTGHRAPVL